MTRNKCPSLLSVVLLSLAFPRALASSVWGTIPDTEGKGQGRKEGQP
jgi:hypothetical protein